MKWTVMDRIYDAVCIECGDPFDSAEADSTKYCSPACRPCTECGITPGTVGCRCDEWESREDWQREHGCYEPWN